MRRVGGLVMLIPNGLPAHAGVQSRALASDPEEGSIALLIVGMLALLLLIGSPAYWRVVSPIDCEGASAR